MNFIKTPLAGAFIIEPRVFEDERGYFFESFRQDEFEAHVGKTTFVQDNESKSSYGVLRGLHYQIAEFAQAKLVRVVLGKVLDIAVDIRSDSPSFGQHLAVELSADNKKQFFIPRGLAHGFVVLSPEVIFQYRVDNVYAPDQERGIRFDDSDLNIDWKIPHDQLNLSPKDLKLPSFSEVFATSS